MTFFKKSSTFFFTRKQCIESENQFDFLKDLVSNIADMPNQDEDENADAGEAKPKKPYVFCHFLLKIVL